MSIDPDELDEPGYGAYPSAEELRTWAATNDQLETRPTVGHAQAGGAETITAGMRALLQREAGEDEWARLINDAATLIGALDIDEPGRGPTRADEEIGDILAATLRACETCPEQGELLEAAWDRLLEAMTRRTGLPPARADARWLPSFELVGAWSSLSGARRAALECGASTGVASLLARHVSGVDRKATWAKPLTGRYIQLRAAAWETWAHALAGATPEQARIIVTMGRTWTGDGRALVNAAWDLAGGVRIDKPVYVEAAVGRRSGGWTAS